MLATPYTLTAVPARLALERRRWAEAAVIEPRTPADYPWERFPAVEAISHFARALGAAQSGEPERAREAVERLATLRDQAAETSEYWAQQVEVQRRAAEAWLGPSRRAGRKRPWRRCAPPPSSRPRPRSTR